MQDVVVPNLTLTAGEQVIRANVGPLDYVNLNYMTFTNDVIVASNVGHQNLRCLNSLQRQIFGGFKFADELLESN